MKRLNFLVIFFLGLVSFSTGTFAADSNDSTRIVMKYRPGQNAEFYVKYYFNTRIPLEQYHPSSNSNLVQITGKIVYDMSELPPDLNEKIIPMMEKLVSGEAEISGTRFDFRDAQVDFVTESKTIPVVQGKRISPTDKDYRYLPPTPHRDEAFYGNPYAGQHVPGSLGWMFSDSYERYNFPPAQNVEQLQAEKKQNEPKPAEVIPEPVMPKQKKPEMTPEERNRESKIRWESCQLLLNGTSGMTRH